MLPATHRMRRPAEFERAVRRGVRGGSASVVVHLSSGPRPDDRDPMRTGQARPAGTLVGFVVSKAVGNAVRRNVVKRRLREIVRPRLGELPNGSSVVVRALPAAAARSFAELTADVQTAWATALRRSDAIPAAAGGAR